jgi:hypothetical protein
MLTCGSALICSMCLQEVKRLGRPVGLTSVAVFGGSGVANQISELKRGTEVSRRLLPPARSCPNEQGVWIGCFELLLMRHHVLSQSKPP